MLLFKTNAGTRPKKRVTALGFAIAVYIHLDNKWIQFDNKSITHSKFMNRILPLICEYWNLEEMKEYTS